MCIVYVFSFSLSVSIDLYLHICIFIISLSIYLTLLNLSHYVRMFIVHQSISFCLFFYTNLSHFCFSLPLFVSSVTSSYLSITFYISFPSQSITWPSLSQSRTSSLASLHQLSFSLYLSMYQITLYVSCHVSLNDSFCLFVLFVNLSFYL